MNDDRCLIDALVHSKLYQDYERAFTDATGLPVALRPVESWQLVHHDRPGENPLCGMLAQKSRACAACLQVQQELSEHATMEPHSVTCQMGLSDTAVPLRLGDKLVGFLQTGQVFRRKPSQAQFERVSRLLDEWGVELDRAEFRRLFFGSRVVPSRQHESIVKLLGIFAQHLTMVGNQILTQQANAEPPMITKAKAFIREHHSEELSLGTVARAVNASTFYFCKMFKKATGINYTDYLSRVRVERAKNLLLNPNLRVSEVAYEVGFQSLTHFNRVFKRVVGQAPTSFRQQLPTT